MSSSPDRESGALHSTEMLSKLLQQCVHCGFCLEACPTYVVDALEADSPRGRIDLLGAALRGEPEALPVARTHLERCLGCLACETACPSGVRYGEILPLGRAMLAERAPLGRTERLVRWTVFQSFPFPRRLRVLLEIGTRLKKWKIDAISLGPLESTVPMKIARASLALLPRTMTSPPPASPQHRSTPLALESSGERRTVVLHQGCVASVIFSSVNRAAEALLEAEGYRVITLFDERCCGALSAHAGRLGEARTAARAMIDRLEMVEHDALLTTAAGCGSAIAEYGFLLRDDPRYRHRAQRVAESAVDAMVFLAQRPSKVKLGPIPRRAVYHYACHLVHGQKAGPEAVERLRSIPELELIELPPNDLCCGSAGTYNILQPDMAHELGRRKAGSVRSLNPDIVVAANPGCHLQLQQHLGEHYQVLHPLELLWEAHQAAR